MIFVCRIFSEKNDGKCELSSQTLLTFIVVGWVIYILAHGLGKIYYLNIKKIMKWHFVENKVNFLVNLICETNL
jgi:hypothetical protein